MKKFLTIILGVVCGGCCAFADELSDKYMDIACDWFSVELNWKWESSQSQQIKKLRLLAEETSDPYDKAAIEELVFIYSDPKFKEHKIGVLSCFVSGPIWHYWPKKEVVDSAFEANKSIMDIDLACDIAYSGRTFGDFEYYFWDVDHQQNVAIQREDAVLQRMEHRKKFLDVRGAHADADSTAIEYIRSNMAPIRRIFRTAERESAIVVSIAPSFKMYKFVWVVSLLGGRVEKFVSPDSVEINWVEFAEIEDWFWINQYKLDSSMIENALSLYSRLGMPIWGFNSSAYEKMLSDELYKEIVKQVAAKGIVPLQECDLSQFQK